MTQEQIVDNIIMDELDIKHPGSKELILSKTTKESRRLAVLSILDDDRRLFEQFKNIIRSEEYCSHYAEETVQVLRKYVQVADTEVKIFGEVMTPLTLVEEMLDKLPTDVWSNPTLKWLDPCNGVGTFPSIIVKRLMVGLDKVIEHPCERYRHIIENMIYVCEIQAKNMFLFHTSFDREDDYELNTYFGSFLDNGFNNHMSNVWGVTKFDIIIGNPPFQKTESNDKRTFPLWDEFVEKVLSNLIEGGYLVFIHPGAWRNAKGNYKPTQELLKNTEMLFLKMYNQKDGKAQFNCDVAVDYYCLRNKKPNNFLTTVVFEDGITLKIDISKLEALPSAKFDAITKLIANDGEEKVQMIWSRSDYGHDKKHISKLQTNEHTHPVVYTIVKDGTIKLLWSNTQRNGHYGVPKVMWSNGSGTIPTIDSTGQYGISDYSYAIIDDVENLENIKKALESDVFLSLMKVAEGPGQSGKYKHRIITLFRKDFWKDFIN